MQELTSPALHRLLAHPTLQHLILGAKGVGSQGDGSAQILCKGPSEQQEVCRVVEAELGMTPLPFTIWKS